MLKRPAEKSWRWAKPPEPFPQTPGANGCFLAPSDMGKTTTLIAMLLGPYSLCFDEVHVFSPSVEIDSAWDAVRQFAQALPQSSFHSEWDEGALLAILERPRRRIKTLKEEHSTRPLPQILTIVDDVADRSDIMHKAGSILTTLFIRGRHFGSSCWLSSQKLTAISTVARVNFRFMLVWRLRNQKEVISLMEELSAIYPVRILHEMYDLATEEPHSFWFIDLVAKSKASMFYVRFEERLEV